MIASILLIVMGVLAIYPLVVAKKPDAKELLDKIVPYQGWIGLVFFVWGVFGIISSILGVGLLAAGLFGIILWVLNLLVNLVSAALGFLLGYGLIAKYILSKNEKAAAKGAEMLEKLRPYQTKLGLAAIIIGVLVLVAGIILTPLIVAVAA